MARCRSRSGLTVHDRVDVFECSQKRTQTFVKLGTVFCESAVKRIDCASHECTRVADHRNVHQHKASLG
jgi:hypothetical protein